MTTELDINREDLKGAICSPGGEYLLHHIDDQIKEGWEKFIALPVAQKTSKAAFNSQAQYEVLKRLKDWIESECKMVD